MRQPKRRTKLKTAKNIVFITLTLFLSPVFAQESGSNLSTQGHKPRMMMAGMMDGGMMGGGMMSGGMMGQSPRNDQAASASVNPKNADALLAYIRSNNLPCTQCHSISDNGFGPSFEAVSANYANRDDAEAVLKDHIEHGFGRMPGGLASNSESAHLARMILDLAKSRTK